MKLQLPHELISILNSPDLAIFSPPPYRQFCAVNNSPVLNQSTMNLTIVNCIILAALLASCTKMTEVEKQQAEPDVASNIVGPVRPYTWTSLATPGNGTTYPSNRPYDDIYTAAVGDTYYAFAGGGFEKVYKLNKSTLQWQFMYTMPDHSGYLFYEHEILFNYNSNIYYCFDNYTERNFGKYDPVSRTKTTLPPFPGSPDSIGSPITFVVGQYGYLFFNGGWGQYWRYGFHTQTWTNLGENPLGNRRDPVIAVVGDKVYAGMGWVPDNDPNQPGRVYKRDWVQFDVNTPGTVVKSNFPGLLRGNAKTCVIGDNIYVGFGSYVNTTFDPPTRLRYDLYKYNTINNTWSECPDWPGTTVTQPPGFGPLRTDVSMFSLGNAVYVVSGGINEFWRYSNQPVIVAQN